MASVIKTEAAPHESSLRQAVNEIQDGLMTESAGDNLVIPLLCQSPESSLPEKKIQVEVDDDDDNFESAVLSTSLHSVSTPREQVTVCDLGKLVLKICTDNFPFYSLDLFSTTFRSCLSDSPFGSSNGK